MKFKNILITFIAVGFLSGWTIAQEHEKIIEKVDVVNVEVPVRVFLQGKPVGDLKKSDFKLLINGKEHQINGFFAIRKKIHTNLTGAESKTPSPETPARLFVLIFNVSDYNAYLQNNIDTLFKKILRPNDRLMVISNNFFLDDSIILDLEREKKRIKKILEIETKRMELELSELRTKLTSLYEDKDDKSEDPVENKRIFIQDYLYYLRKFKNSLLNPDTRQYIKIANYLRGQKIEKWVFNFYQLGMFYYPDILEEFIEGVEPGSELEGANQEDVREWKTMDLMEYFLKAHKELQGVDKDLIDNVGKFFINSGATFHTQLLRGSGVKLLEGYVYDPITLPSENILARATALTGGSIVNSNKIDTFFQKITASEDICYFLTYNPGKIQEKNQKIKVVVKDDRYHVIYDDQERPRYIRAITGEPWESPRVVLKNISFKNETLSFTTANIKLVPAENKQTGHILVKIRIMDNESKILFAREKKIVTITREKEFKIKNFPLLKKGLYDFIIEVYDLNTDKNDLAIQEVRVSS